MQTISHTIVRAHPSLTFGTHRRVKVLPRCGRPFDKSLFQDADRIDERVVCIQRDHDFQKYFPGLHTKLQDERIIDELL